MILYNDMINPIPFIILVLIPIVIYVITRM